VQGPVDPRQVGPAGAVELIIPIARDHERRSSAGPGGSSDAWLAYASYLYATGRLTPTALRRIPDPLFDLAAALGLNPVRGQDAMNGKRAIRLVGIVQGMGKDKRGKYTRLARQYAPALEGFPLSLPREYRHALEAAAGSLDADNLRSWAEAGVDLHKAALRNAGFREVGVIWHTLDNRVLTGTVTQIALLPQAASTGGQAYPVIVTLGGVPPEVHAGMSVRVTLPG